MIVAITEKKKSSAIAAIIWKPLSPVIAATTIAEIEPFLSHDRWKVVSITIAVIAELFFPQRSQR